MRGQLLLCEFAEVSNGKLTAVGAGWNQAQPGPRNMSLAMFLTVDGSETKRQYDLKIRLTTLDGREALSNGAPVTADGKVEVQELLGNLPEVSVPFTVTFQGVNLVAAGIYKFEMEIAGKVLATALFEQLGG